MDSGTAFAHTVNSSSRRLSSDRGANNQSKHEGNEMNNDSDLRRMMELVLNELPSIQDGLWGRAADLSDPRGDEDRDALFAYLKLQR